MNRLADAKNNYKRYKLLQQLLAERSQTLLNSIHTINQIAFGSVEILGQETIDDLKNTMDRFEQNIQDQKQQNKELKKITRRMDDILDNAIDNDDESYQRSEELAADQKRWKQMNQSQNEKKRGQTDVEVRTL